MLLELREEHRDKDGEEGSGSLAAQRNRLNISFSQAEALQRTSLLEIRAWLKDSSVYQYVHVLIHK